MSVYQVNGTDGATGAVQSTCQKFISSVIAATLTYRAHLNKAGIELSLNCNPVCNKLHMLCLGIHISDCQEPVTIRLAENLLRE